jgi:hypothetical protein
VGEKTLVKSLLISTLDKVMYYIGTTKPLFAILNRLEIICKKSPLFSNMLLPA